MVFTDCTCEPDGTEFDNCHYEGKCECKQNIVGIRCDVCFPGFYGFPDCHKGIIFLNSFSKFENETR